MIKEEEENGEEMRRGVRFQEEEGNWRLTGLLNTDDLGLRGESVGNLRAIVGQFVEVCKRRGLKLNADKRKVMVLSGEEGLECEFCVDGIRLENVSEFLLDESCTDEAEYCRKMASGRRAAVAIKFLVNARDLQLECARVL